jgi:hypothetical protein
MSEKPCLSDQSTKPPMHHFYLNPKSISMDIVEVTPRQLTPSVGNLDSRVRSRRFFLVPPSNNSTIDGGEITCSSINFLPHPYVSYALSSSYRCEKKLWHHFSIRTFFYSCILLLSTKVFSTFRRVKHFMFNCVYIKRYQYFCLQISIIRFVIKYIFVTS